MRVREGHGARAPTMEGLMSYGRLLGFEPRTSVPR